MDFVLRKALAKQFLKNVSHGKTVQSESFFNTANLQKFAEPESKMMIFMMLYYTIFILLTVNKSLLLNH